MKTDVKPAQSREDPEGTLAERMSRVRHTLVVLSGKGGVGKSTVAVNLASAMAEAGKRVGLLDVDLHGPSVPRMLGIEDQQLFGCDEGLVPARCGDLSVVSIGFMLKDDDSAVIWRGPRKASLIRQFLADVAWGELDYLVIDAPPGTGDEPLAVCELTAGKRLSGEPASRGAVLVTTPQGVALADVMRCIRFCREVGMPVHGLIENMSCLTCPHCGGTVDLYHRGGGEELADEYGLPFLGRIPLDPAIVNAGEEGTPLLQTTDGAARASAEIFTDIARRIMGEETKVRMMRYAVPVDSESGPVSAHFGHCRRFLMIDVDPVARTIARTETKTPPPHEQGVIPRWLAEQKADVLLTGGIGGRAREILARKGISVVSGVAATDASAAVLAHLSDDLATGDNTCDHRGCGEGHT